MQFMAANYTDVSGDIVSESSDALWQRKAMDYLARREYGAEELRRRLQNKGASADVIERVLCYLQQHNLQSDQRFCENYIRYRAHKGFGPRRIQQELSQRGVDKAYIAEALAQVDIDWQQLAHEVLCKKFNTDEVPDLKTKAKQQRFLHYRGFVFGEVAS